MKTAIFAAAKGYTPEQVKPWVSSLKSTGFDGKVFVVLYNHNEKELADYFKEQDFYVMFAVERGVTHIATQRFSDYAEILEGEYCQDIDYVLHTDIRDVIFQSNPDTWIRENIGSSGIIASSEGITYRHEDWNGDGLQKQFGLNIYNQFADTETLCSGVIAGKKDVIVKLFKTMYELAFFSQEPEGFIDQHFYNLAIRKPFASVTKISTPEEDWALNCGTTIAIPMNDQNWSSGSRTPYSSYERIRKGNYVENMLCDLPQMIDGKVCTPSGKPYVIVHQYDRYQPWYNEIVKQ